MRVVHYAAGDWGVGELWFDGDGLPVWHELPTRARAEHDAARRAGSIAAPGAAPLEGAQAPLSDTVPGPGSRVRDDVVPDLVRRAGAYFAGARVVFDDVPIDLEWCTPFQLAVAQALRAVPYGETVSYGELAAIAGHPNAQRAVGTFCAHNRLPLILPCHRVVGADGIGKYGSLGVEYKRRLLELERAAL